MADDDGNETKYNDGNSNNNEKTAEDNHESELGPEYQGKILGPSIFQQNIVQRPITKSRNYLEYGYTTQFNIDISNIDEAIINAFKLIDTNSSGRLSRSEMLSSFCNRNGSQFTRETILLLCGMFDSDNSGGLDLYDFARLYFFMEDWIDLWKLYDVHQKGWVNASEMYRALKDLGYKKIDPIVVQSLAHKFGKTGKKLYIDPFIRICAVCKRITDNFRKKDKRREGRLRMSYNDFIKLSLRSCF
ncbi:peflin-like [Varroa destructor]|uniref:EF-hand domain-containing protein n=1 Tax=Varroa destructor TaxID=109461 RepID=A0A7M7JRY6_VARDE|nr:peflin-like [Varroa destructor]